MINRYPTHFGEPTDYFAISEGFDDTIVCLSSEENYQPYIVNVYETNGSLNNAFESDYLWRHKCTYCIRSDFAMKHFGIYLGRTGDANTGDIVYSGGIITSAKITTRGGAFPIIELSGVKTGSSTPIQAGQGEKGVLFDESVKWLPQVNAFGLETSNVNINQTSVEYTCSVMWNIIDGKYKAAHTYNYRKIVTAAGEGGSTLYKFDGITNTESGRQQKWLMLSADATRTPGGVSRWSGEYQTKV